MTPPRAPDSGDDNDITTRTAFDTALERVVATARDANVPLEGAYNVRSPRPDVPDYTIEVTEQTKRVPGSQA
jgi:hypothetical protein